MWKKYKKYLTEGLSDKNITTEIYENDAGAKICNIYILHGDKFISEYQGRLYVSRISDAVNPDGSIKTEFLLESTSELFRVYQKDKTILSTYEIGLVEESLK